MEAKNFNIKLRGVINTSVKFILNRGGEIIIRGCPCCRHGCHFRFSSQGNIGRGRYTGIISNDG